MISIIIVNWNSGGLLEKCVRSLLEYAEGYQIVIVDNASTDASLNFAEEIETIRILRNSRNMGFAAANNTGWRSSCGTRILFLNPDTECLPESIRILEQTLVEDSTIWAAGGRLVDSAGNPQERYVRRLFPGIATVAAEMFFLEEVWPSNPWSGHVDMAKQGAMDVDQPAAACLMVNREALEKIGGFDESFYPAWFEDVDLCRRICNQGGRIRYQPQARFVHYGGSSLGQMSRQDFLKIFHMNEIRYFRKHHGPAAASHVRRMVISGLLIRGCLSLVRPLAPGQSRSESARTFWNAARHLSNRAEAGL